MYNIIVINSIGHPTLPNERSPIFLQFLDCVYQLTRQYPTAFQFNTQFLLLIADCAYSRWFGTFLRNTEQESLRIREDTLSIWDCVLTDKERIISLEYEESYNVLKPVCSLKRIKLWEEYFLRYIPNSYATLSLLGWINGYSRNSLIRPSKFVQCTYSLFEFVLAEIVFIERY